MIGQGSIGSIGNILGSASALQNITSSTTTAMPLTTSVIFHATIQVVKAANGYIVNIGRREGYEYETFIAESIVQVNEVIAAQMVAMKLEGK